MERRIEYVSDGNHNYLRINCGEERKNSYSYRMITENAIKGLLPSSIRVVNGVTFLYFEICAKQSLYYRYETKEMDYEALKNLFFYICCLGEELEKYLLDFHNIVFDEKYIFQNVGTGETGFLFLPGEEKQGSFSKFMEYVVQHINHKDAKAVQISYQLYDLSRQPSVSVKNMRELFEEEEQKEFSAGQMPIERDVQPEILKPEKTISDCEIELKNTEAKKSELESKGRTWNDIMIPSLLCIVLTILLCIKIACPLTYGQSIILLAGMIVDVGLMIGYVLYRLFQKKEQQRERANAPVKDWEIYDTERKAEENNLPGVSGMTVEEDYNGETLFWEPEPENVLNGLGKYEKLTISLNHFPFSVGKMKEEVDYAIKDNSVSRLHARFYQEEKAVYLMDLNSTNGTCKNGFRIPPNEKVLLEEGDEVSFGKIRFCYR